MLDVVPRLKEHNRNEAKRFMTLIDVLYEHKVNLVMAAEAPPHELYPEGRHAFKFERTVSRLMAMQSNAYPDAPHRAATPDRTSVVQGTSVSVCVDHGCRRLIKKKKRRQQPTRI